MNAYEGKAGMVYLQINLCDPCLVLGYDAATSTNIPTFRQKSSKTNGRCRNVSAVDEQLDVPVRPTYRYVCSARDGPC